MKELMATARNIIFTADDSNLHCIVEAVLTVSEPTFELDRGGAMVRLRVPEVIRFGSPPSGMRELAQKMNDWADEADKTYEMITNGDMTMPCHE